MIKIAIQTAVVPGQDMNEKYANAKQLGFDGVEISAWSFADGKMHINIEKTVQKSNLCR